MAKKKGAEASPDTVRLLQSLSPFYALSGRLLVRLHGCPTLPLLEGRSRGPTRPNVAYVTYVAYVVGGEALRGGV